MNKIMKINRAKIKTIRKKCFNHLTTLMNLIKNK